MAYLATGNVARAGELAGEARREFEQAGDERYLSAVLDTEARVALASDDAGEAIKLARRAVALAEESGNQAVQLGAMLTEARALRANGETDEGREPVRRPPPPWRGRAITRRACARSCASGRSCAPRAATIAAPTSSPARRWRSTDRSHVLSIKY